MVTHRPASHDLSELSAVIGELRNFQTAQAIVNADMLGELKKISDCTIKLAELSAVFVEYRHTLHERFAKIHLQFSDVDDILDKHIITIRKLEHQHADWTGNIKLLLAIGWVLGTLASAILSSYIPQIVKAIVRASQ